MIKLILLGTLVIVTISIACLFYFIVNSFEKKVGLKMTRTPQIKFAKVHRSATIPKYEHEGDSGFDFISIKPDDITFGEVTLVRTGLKVEMPELWFMTDLGHTLPYKVMMELQLRAKSGLSSKYGVTLANGIGTIDWGYRGEIILAMTKLTPGVFHIEQGMKVAQGVFAPVFYKGGLKFLEVVKEELNDSSRGEGGFGSTGS